MTNEDAISREAVIRLVEQYPNIIGNRCSGLIADIKHLPPITPSYNSVKTELKPSEDCISREDTLNKINTLVAEYIPLMPTGWTLPLNIAKTINELPSVTPSHEDLKEAYINGYDYGVKDWFKSKTQPCDDAISREDTIREIQDKYGDNAVGIDIVDIVAHLPSVRPCREIVEDKRACERCIHYVTRDSRGVVLCGCDSWECDFEEVKT